MLMDFHNRSGSMPAPPPDRSPGGGGGGGGVGYGGGVRGTPADLLPPLELAVAVRRRLLGCTYYGATYDGCPCDVYTCGTTAIPSPWHRLYLRWPYLLRLYLLWLYVLGGHRLPGVGGHSGDGLGPPRLPIPRPRRRRAARVRTEARGGRAGEVGHGGGATAGGGRARGK